MAGSYFLYNELHYNGLMTDLGLYTKSWRRRTICRAEIALLYIKDE